MIIEAINGNISINASSLFGKEEVETGGDEQGADTPNTNESEVELVDDEEVNWDDLEDAEENDILSDLFNSLKTTDNTDSDDDDISDDSGPSTQMPDFNDTDESNTESEGNDSENKTDDSEDNDESTDDINSPADGSVEQTDEAGEDESSTGNDSDEGNVNEEPIDDEPVEGNTTAEESIETEEELPDELTDEQMKKLETQIQKQNDFVEGNVDKSAVDQKKDASIEAIDNADIDIEIVGKDINTYVYNGKGIEVIVVNNLSQGLIDANPFGVFYDAKYSKDRVYNNTKNIEAGTVLGTMLGRKLQIRNEENNIKFTRLNNGRVDKRLINAIGYGAERIFSQVMTDVFKPACLHISIDASGSMSGSKWNNTMISVVAICKAASMISNLEVVVDFRMTTDTTGYGNDTRPLVLIAYDSRKDKFEKIRRLFPYISVNCTTPEGLCFEAILKTMVNDKNKDQYFINFSDGEPCFSCKGFEYYGNSAANHTKKQVDAIRAKGIKVLSYYISTCKDGQVSSSFKTMYGKDAVSIDVTAIIPLAKTINNLFLER